MSLTQRLSLTWWIILLTQTVQVASAMAQEGTYFGTVPYLDSAGVASVRRMLSDDPVPRERWEDALKILFGAAYQPQFADVVVFIPDTGRVRQGLFRNRELRHELPGLKYLWVLVLADSRWVDATTCPKARLPHLKPPKCKKAVQVKLTSLDYEDDRLLASVAKLVTKIAAADVKSPARDTLLEVQLERIGPERGGHALYLALARLTLNQNTSNRVSIRPVAPLRFPEVRSIHHTFANGSSSPFSVGLGGGLTFDSETATEKKDGTFSVQATSVRAELYIFTGLQLKRRYPPTKNRSFDVTLGTNLTGGDILDDLVIGVSVGGLIYADEVFTIGVNWREEKEVNESVDPAALDTKRRVRLFLGLHVRI